MSVLGPSDLASAMRLQPLEGGVEQIRRGGVLARVTESGLPGMRRCGVLLDGHCDRDGVGGSAVGAERAALAGRSTEVASSR